MRESRTSGFVRGAHSNTCPYRDPYFPIYCIYLRCKSAYRKGFVRPRLSTGQALTCYRGCLLERRTHEATKEEKR
jgi:hypothetical protein